MDKIAIILPTYNGEKYILDTLNSLESQTVSNMTVFIRDDGSTDETLDLLALFIAKKELKNEYILIQDNEGNLGCPASFYQIIRSQPLYDFYAFCDQDDVWLPDKIERAIRSIKQVCKSDPVVYYSSFDYCDEDFSFIRHAPMQTDELKLAKTLYYTPGLGFTIAFNGKACKKFILDVDPGDQMHDRWILRCGACMGKVVYDKKATALHVRHTEAVTADDNRTIDLFKYYIKNEFYGHDSDDSRRKMAYFLQTFQKDLCQNDINTLKLFKESKGTISDKLSKVFFPQRLRASILSEISLRILFLFGKA